MKVLAILLLMFSVNAIAESNEITITRTSPEVECLAKNIYFEARGEPPIGQIAIINVTLNRVASDKFPDTICDVVKQARHSKWWKEHHNREVPVRNRCQFSWYCDGLPDEPQDLEAYEEAHTLARAVSYSGFRMVDITNGALHYHAVYVNPYWAEHMTVTRTIGKHVFYASR